MISSWTSDMKAEEKGEEEEDGGSVDLKCLSVSGDDVMIWRRASDPLQRQPRCSALP